MAMSGFERQILQELRERTGIRKLKEKDMLEWSTGDIKPKDGETIIRLPFSGVNVAYPTPK